MSFLKWMIAAMLVLPPVFFAGVWILLDRNHRTQLISTHPSLGIKLSHHDDCLVLTKHRAVKNGSPKQMNARTMVETSRWFSRKTWVCGTPKFCCMTDVSPGFAATIQTALDKLFVKPGWRGFRYSASSCGWTLKVSTWMPTILTAPLLAPFVVLTHRSRRHRRRARSGLCITCGYNLTGNVSGICPECGTALKPRSD